MYDARQIANWFVQRAQKDGRELTIMQLLKLVYIAYGWHFEMRKSKLFPNRIEAWQHGPVIPDVYRSFRRQGIIAKSVVDADKANFGDRYDHFLEEIYKIYGDMGAFQLSEKTHEPGGPWDLAVKRHGLFSPLSDQDILEHYTAKRAAAS
ncbi:Panacea domain-containing protein [Paracoccus sulfuroxidans]|uniref:Putative phage-associated protein n=1 Tax=Paracoccus sulfuroxidans TaxID=384678 RepID=A0A562N445_9RHOB|nr:type II toxin-antitoxin system antitoxin SocA domain-containing protein [Paracoccus sulfuroxidans]AZV00322.1 hypothetical protein psul1_p14 [Paracoccus phage vB_PsuS_Psul1]TWI26947.1 putative phage-associated protein [Paracoccus sulfuroxidans]